jgi:phosphoserine phosphatase
MTNKLVCFDLEGTLIDDKTSWLTITENLGCDPNETLSIYRAAMEGKISFAEGEKMVAEMFRKGGKAMKQFIEQIFEKETLKPKAIEIVEFLKNKGYAVWLISGAVDIHVRSMAQKLGVAGFYSVATLEFDQQGILSKINYGGDQGPWKAGVVRELAAKYNIPVQEIIFVGDGENDIDVFKETGRGIAVFPYDERLEKIAWKKVKSLSEIKDILQ